MVAAISLADAIPRLTTLPFTSRATSCDRFLSEEKVVTFKFLPAVKHSRRIQIHASSVHPNAPQTLTCKNCKRQFNPAENHPRACRFHTAHFGGETKRKFEGVYTGGTMDTVGGGEVTAYWHCCGSTDPFDVGCEASPHLSYDD